MNSWIKDLILEEQDMEATGMITPSGSHFSEQFVETETLEFLKELKTIYITLCKQYNDFKGSAGGHIKVYGISGTLTDFMLFKNNFKLVFSYNAPGFISIKSNRMSAVSLPGQESTEDAGSIQGMLEAKRGIYDNLVWTYKDQDVALDPMCKYFLTKFVRESF